MKKILCSVLLGVTLSLGLATMAWAEEKTMILKIGDQYMTVNGQVQELDPGRGTKPLIVQGRTLVPIRTIIENMGGSIAWNGELQQVTMTTSNKTVRMTLGYKIAEIKTQAAGDNWTQKTLEVAPQSINGRTMVPLRFVTEELGANVNWDGTTKSITITFNTGNVDPLNWAGTWDTDNGIMSFQQVGNNVATVSNNEYFGKITGKVEGNKLTGKWFIDVSHQGDIILTIAEDGKTFTGVYNYNSPGDPFTPDPEDPEAGWFGVAGQR